MEKGKRIGERRHAKRMRRSGTGVILRFGYLSNVYQLVDLSESGACLRGVMRPPAECFEMLILVSGWYTECRARTVWHHAGSLGVVFEPKVESPVLASRQAQLDGKAVPRQLLSGLG